MPLTTQRIMAPRRVAHLRPLCVVPALGLQVGHLAWLSCHRPQRQGFHSALEVNGSDEGAGRCH
eukprot:3763340-Prymnesium_polylepis.2